MPDTRRQTIIIAVLIVLIAVAGVFAKRFNAGMENSATSAGLEQENVTTIQEMRVTHQNDKNAVKQEYETLSQDKNISAKQREEAAAKYMALIDNGNKENTVEVKLKEQGFGDALCMIGENVEVYVKVTENLTKEQTAKIMDTVVRETKMAPKLVTIKQGN